jgi:hypothetical protein
VKRGCATAYWIADNSIWFTDEPNLACGTGSARPLNRRISAPISKSSFYEVAMKASSGRRVSRARDA